MENERMQPANLAELPHLKMTLEEIDRKVRFLLNFVCELEHEIRIIITIWNNF